MLRLEDAKKIAHGTNLTSRDQLCVLLALEPADPLQITEIRKRCSAIGLPRLAKKNVSDILGKAKGFVARTTSGWELQQSGLDLVRKLASESKVNLVVTNSSSSLRTHADGLSDPLTKSFVMEAIYCFEAQQYRAAVVFSWAGAVALLHKYVFSKSLLNSILRHSGVIISGARLNSKMT